MEEEVWDRTGTCGTGTGRAGGLVAWDMRAMPAQHAYLPLYAT